MRCSATVLSMLLVPSFLLAQVSAPKQIGTSVAPINVLTYHDDNMRTGLMPLETILTPANVKSTTFGKLGVFSTDGKVDGEPLYVSNVTINGVARNVIYVATEHDSVYAFDANSLLKLWQVTVLTSGEMPGDEVYGCTQVNPEVGITDTPVIDRNKNAIYFVAMTKDSNSVYHQRLHALDLATGTELFGGPTEIQAKYPGTGDNSHNGFVVFDPEAYYERSALLELAGNIYLTFTSHCDREPYTGWLLQYSSATLQQTGVLNVTPNGGRGAIWQAGTGIAADADGNIYFLDANGTFDTTLDGNGFPINGDYGNAMIKVSTSGGLKVADYFNTYNTVLESQQDLDLGSGGAILLPDISVSANKKVHLVIGAGKDGNIYVASRDNMGKWNPNNNNNLYQQLTGALPNGSWSMPAYFHNTVYFGGLNDFVKAFPIVSGKLAPLPSSQTSTSYIYPGPTPSVSSNQSQNGILWAIEVRGDLGTAILHAYNALDLTQELYNSDQAGFRDEFGPSTRFNTPMIANGRVYVSTPTGVVMFGLFQQGAVTTPH
jgi:hypothetical protein